MITLKKALFITLFLLASGQVSAEEVLLDSFEGKIEKGTVDFGAAAGSSLEAAADQSQKACGNQSLKLTYNLATGGYMYSARGFELDAPQAQWDGPAFDTIKWQDFNGISFQMNDETATPGAIALDVKDAGGELWRFTINNDKKGWTQIVVPFDQLQRREDWQPTSADGNRTLDFPIKSYQWEPKTPGEGTIYFDCVTLVQK